ncbi:MAG: DUF3826 domain-containing protein [Bacteroidales bacterium]
MRLHQLWLVLLLICGQTVFAVDLNKENRDEKYVTSIVARSKKIVDKLNISDPQRAQEVTNVIANRYFLLNDIYEKRDIAVKAVKESDADKEKKDAAIRIADSERDAALYHAHFAFEGALSLYLDEKQVEEVKNGMTYNVVNVTYTAYLDMIPSLKEDEKIQIMAWLKEAREYAMNGENSNKKHAVFGKFKGRINNYLAARGYDLQAERKGWYERIEAAKK